MLKWECHKERMAMEIIRSMHNDRGLYYRWWSWRIVLAGSHTCVIDELQRKPEQGRKGEELEKCMILI
jgi:hypothetical protein